MVEQTPPIDHHLSLIYEEIDNLKMMQIMMNHKLDELLIIKQYTREMNNTIRQFINKLLVE